MRLATSPLLTFGLLCCFAVVVRADTEIRNFGINQLELMTGSTDVPATTKLSLYSHQRQLSLGFSNAKCKVLVDLIPSEKDERYSSWTARLSWPGSSPTFFDMKVGNSNRTIQVLIHASPLSPRIPINDHPRPYEQWLSCLLKPTSQDGSRPTEWTTDAHLVFEPLMLGVVPRTTIRTVGLLLVFGIGAGLAVPMILRITQNILDDDGFNDSKAEVAKKDQ